MSTSLAITVISMSLMFVIAGLAAGYSGSHDLEERVGWWRFPLLLLQSRTNNKFTFQFSCKPMGRTK